MSTAVPGPRVQALTLPRYMLGWHSLLERCHERYGDVFRIRYPWLGSVVVLAHPDAVREIMSDAKAAIGGPIRNRFGAEELVSARTVPFLDGDPHLRRRRTLLPRFYGGASLDAYEQVMVQIVDEHVAGWNPGDVIRLSRLAGVLSAEMVARVLFGISDRAALARCRALLPRLIPAWGATRVLPAWAKSERVPGPWRRYARMRAEVRELIERQIREHRESGARSADLCSLLLSANAEAEDPMSDEEVREELLIAALGSIHSTAIAISWVFDCVLHDADALAELEADPDDKKLASAMIEEALRLRELSDTAPRILTEDMELSGVRIRAGEIVFPAFYLVHRRPDVYERAGEFVPERFLGQRPPTYAWLPFGGGTHRCIGATLSQLEMRVVLREVLRRWKIRPVRTAPSRPRRGALFWAPVGGVKVRVTAPAGAPRPR
jgi:cytochrome P450 family 135